MLCFIYFEHTLSKYQASRAKGWLFQQLQAPLGADVNSSNPATTKCALYCDKTLETDWRSTYSYAMTRRTCLRNKQGYSTVRRPNLRSLSNPDR